MGPGGGWLVFVNDEKVFCAPAEHACVLLDNFFLTWKLFFKLCTALFISFSNFAIWHTSNTLLEVKANF